jgi:hypothetical protein
VTTPQEVAVLDAKKSISFARKIQVPVTGVIENMSGLCCPHCSKEINLFKKGGGQTLALEQRVPFLGAIPVNIDFVTHGDRGTFRFPRRRRSFSASFLWDCKYTRSQCRITL